jgi:hypothetical protein
MKRKMIRNKLDKKVGEIVRSKGYCVKCGKEQNLQACHIFSRKNLSTRWDLENVICMCAGCHFWSHTNPVLFGEFVKEYLGELRYEALKARATAIKKWRDEELDNYYKVLDRLV